MKYIPKRIISACFLLLSVFLLQAFTHNTYAAEDAKVLFEGVGNYAFATAGNNNTYRGDSYETFVTTRKVIAPEDNSRLPANWEAIKAKLASDGYEINNLSGSYLDAKGTIKYAEVNYFNLRSSCGQGNTKEERNESTNPIYIILIAPSGDYTVVKDTHADVTSFIKNQKTIGGWYYAAYWTPIQVQCMQASWALTAVYENPDLETSYIELVNPDMYFYDGTTNTLDRRFKTGPRVIGDTQLIGVYIGAGVSAWPSYSGDYNTKDQTYAILNDGSVQQLYETTYRGKKVFAGRTNIDFANGIFGTTRSHDIDGGEVDIFDETVGNDFFNNKEMVGYRVVKEQPEIYLEPMLFGVRKVIEIPELTVTPKIPEKDPAHPTITIKNIGKYGACATEMVMPLGTVGNIIKVDVTPSTGNTYEIKDNKLILKTSNLLVANSEIKISLTLKEPTLNPLELNPSIIYYPAYGDTCSAEITNNPVFKLTASGADKYEASTIRTPNTGDSTKNQDDSKLVYGLLIPISAVVTAFVIYTIGRLKHRVDFK